MQEAERAFEPNGMRRRGTDRPSRRTSLALQAALLAQAFAAPAYPQAVAAGGAPQESGGSFLRAADHRVAEVAYRLAVAGAALCPDAYPLTGLLLHHLADYDAEGARLVLAAWPLGRGPGVLAVVAGSPAAEAGLRAGDVITEINGRPVPDAMAIAAIPGAKPRRAAVEEAEAVIEAELRRGPARLAVVRAGTTHAVTLGSRPGCPARVRLARSNQPNAFANGRWAVVTTRVMDFTRSEDELAVVIAHELSHNILAHKQKLDAQGVPKGLLRRFGKNAGRIRATEEEADRLGVRLVAAAGYDVSAILPFWRRFYARFDSPQLFRTHPGLRAREQLISKVLAEIASDPRAQRP